MAKEKHNKDETDQDDKMIRDLINKKNDQTRALKKVLVNISKKSKR